MTTISPLTAADHDAWLPLWQGYLDFYEEQLAPEITELTFARFLDPLIDMHAALARDDAGQAVGFVHWLTHPGTWARGPYCYLEDLFVAPGVRGGGVGRTLIAHVRAWAEERGASKLYWHTQFTNATARVLYDKLATDAGHMMYEIEL